MDLTDTPDVRGDDEEPPDFTDWLDPGEISASQSTRERLLDVVVQLREPTKVSAVAERASCGTETARDYLEWFEQLGVVRQVGSRPALYERNDSYLQWRRVERIRAAYTEVEIVDELASTVDALAEFRDRFGVDSPDAVSLVHADRDVEELWEAVSRWKTLERRAALLDAARRERLSDGSRVDVADV